MSRKKFHPTKLAREARIAQRKALAKELEAEEEEERRAALAAQIAAVDAADDGEEEQEEEEDDDDDALGDGETTGSRTVTRTESKRFGRSDSRASAKSDDGEAATHGRVMTKVKIIIATYQIATSLPWSLPQIRFPEAVEQALKLGSIVNLSLISFAKLECFGDITFFDSLLFVTLLPIAVLLVIAVVCGLRLLCVPPESRTRVLYKGGYWMMFALYCFVPSTSGYCFKYFACATYEGYDGKRAIEVLRADSTISCRSPGYDAWLPYVVLCILVYPVGVPLGFGALLWRLRDHLNPDVTPPPVHESFKESLSLHRSRTFGGAAPLDTPSPRPRRPSLNTALERAERDAFADIQTEEDADYLEQALERHREAMRQLQKLEKRAHDPRLKAVRFLYEEFEPRCYMFIVYEVVRRIFLTGCLTMFMPGSISQIAIGLLGTLISYRICNFYRPYIEEDDNIISEVAQTQLVIIFFYALMVYATTNLEEQDGIFSGKVFAILLVIIIFSVLFVAVWLVLVAHFGHDQVKMLFSTAKDRAARCKKLRERMRRGLRQLRSGSFRLSKRDVGAKAAATDDKGGGPAVPDAPLVEAGDLVPRDMPQESARLLS